MEAFQRIVGTAALLLACLPIMAAAEAAELPEIVRLDSMANLYKGVDFDHAMHMEVSDDCSSCHHHTVGIPTTDERCSKCHDSEEMLETVTCGNCHKRDPSCTLNGEKHEATMKRYHRDMPGLNAAYHLNCMGCHKEWGGPIACGDCHQRTKAGERFYYSDSYKPHEEPKIHITN